REVRDVTPVDEVMEAEHLAAGAPGREHVAELVEQHADGHQQEEGHRAGQLAVEDGYGIVQELAPVPAQLDQREASAEQVQPPDPGEEVAYAAQLRGFPGGYDDLVGQGAA